MATLEFSHNQGRAQSVNQTPAGHAQVDEILRATILNSDLLKNLLQIERERVVARPLREDTETQCEHSTFAVGLRGEELAPRHLLVLVLDGDGSLDLRDFAQDERGRGITFRVVLDEDSVGLLVAVVGDEITRGLGDEGEGEQLCDTGDELEERGDSPGPGGFHVEGTEGDSGGDDGTDEPGTIEERGHDGAFLGMREFSDKGRGGHNGEGDSVSEENARHDEHGEVLGGTLEDGADNHDE